ncbi:hypothetical protein [Metaclostridioides mangenotii]|uniref:hypothetical protein n=1 Tax=Metaclostridioides mangenotii TaxID=1540 RepID=UPI0004666A9A|nr:hypothetical protein [Clostridioides mangenotii]
MARKSSYQAIGKLYFENKCISGKNLYNKTSEKVRQTAIYACGEIAVNDLMSVTKAVKMLAHVLGQISYKKGCFHYVVNELKKWGNKNIYRSFHNEVIEVHGR